MLAYCVMSSRSVFVTELKKHLGVYFEVAANTQTDTNGATGALKKV